MSDVLDREKPCECSFCLRFATATVEDPNDPLNDYCDDCTSDGCDVGLGDHEMRL